MPFLTFLPKYSELIHRFAEDNVLTGRINPETKKLEFFIAYNPEDVVTLIREPRVDPTEVCLGKCDFL